MVDALLSEHRATDAPKHCFIQAREVAEQPPECVTTDGRDSYPRAIRDTLGDEVVDRRNPNLNNRIEQEHLGAKQRCAPMRGFGTVDAAARVCRAFDEQGHYFRVRMKMRESTPPLAAQRREYGARATTLIDELMVA